MNATRILHGLFISQHALQRLIFGHWRRQCDLRAYVARRDPVAGFGAADGVVRIVS